jgi:tetratricopeptide (TPR) repeat protein/peroxiredoxin
MHIPIRHLALLAALSPVFLGTRAQTAQEDAMAIAARAYQLQQSGEYNGAAEAYRAFLKLRPDEVGAHSNLGVVLTKLGRYDEAISEYEAAEKLLPGDSRISMNLALAYEKSGRLVEAANKLQAVHDAAPHEDQITILLADARLQAGENDRAIELLQPLEQQSPNDLAIAYILGTALIRQQRISEGQILLDRILKNGDSAEARFLLGTQMYESGDYPASVKQFAAAVEANPNLPELQAYYGQALLTTGDADGAAAAFRRELQLNRNNYAANLGLGEILTVRKRFSEASPLLRQALIVRPQSSDAKLALAECLKGEDKLQDARQLLQSVIKAMPDSIEAHLELSQVDAELKLTKEASTERATAERLRNVAEAKFPSSGPKIGELAPGFTLPDAVSGKSVSLNEFRGKGPVVLIFGSQSCPNFRASAQSLKSLQARYGTEATFLLVYIREAHAGGDWQSTRNERDGIDIPQARTLSERKDHAVMCSRSLHLPFPALLDGIDDLVATAYGAWPSRAFVIDRDGRVRYSTRLTELDYSAEEMETSVRDSIGMNRASKER